MSCENCDNKSNEEIDYRHTYTRKKTTLRSITNNAISESTLADIVTDFFRSFCFSFLLLWLRFATRKVHWIHCIAVKIIRRLFRVFFLLSKSHRSLRSFDYFLLCQALLFHSNSTAKKKSIQFLHVRSSKVADQLRSIVSVWLVLFPFKSLNAWNSMQHQSVPPCRDFFFFSIVATFSVCFYLCNEIECRKNTHRTVARTQLA